MQTFHTFKNIENFEKFLHSGKYEKEQSGTLDYVTIGGIVYTMHEYDMNGQSVTWANKKHARMIEMATSNRYKNGYHDAKVIEYPADFLREDITYYE